jgi:hypothetical protein
MSPEEMARVIAEADAKGQIVSIGGDGERWILNYVEDPDRT